MLQNSQESWVFPVFKKALLFLLVVAGSGLVNAQSKVTAQRAGDLQVGGGYTIANSDYAPEKYKGFMLYADFDFKEHWGIEAAFHQVNQPSGKADMYERTYEIGGRYKRIYLDGRLRPYAKVMVGRGVYNFPNNVANLAYNMYALGGGVDVRVTDRINVRAFDFEYQKWLSFPPNGLAPMLGSFGVAYHFGGNDRTP